MKKVLLLAPLLIGPALLTGCASDTVGIAGLCNSWKSIRISKDDVLTEGTASQIEGNNLAHKAVGCK